MKEEDKLELMEKIKEKGREEKKRGKEGEKKKKEGKSRGE